MGETGKTNGFRQEGLKQNNYKGMSVIPFKKENRLALSAKATGILYYFLSKPDGWHGQLFDLLKHFKDGRDSIRSGIKELCDAGYLERVHTQKNGKFVGSFYRIFDEPQTKNSHA